MIDTILYHGLYYFGADLLVDTSPLPNAKSGDVPSQMLPNVLNLVFGVLGSAAVLVIVLSGLQYMLATGDPGKISQSRKTILYALVGLAIALSGFAIVEFVIKGLMS